MFVELSSGGDPAVVLREPDNFKQFHVAAHALTDDEVGAALAGSGAGTWDGDHAWISTAFLERNGRPDSNEWQEGFAAMVRYAAKSGWTSADGKAIRAHVERVTQ
ncbi:MAG TPA: hypothetical protein VGM12_26585 [Trebonia sp.]